MSLRSVVVVGTGVMAPGIALACADAGLKVVIAGRNPVRAKAAAELADVGYAPIEANTFDGCDLVIETILEDAHAKHQLYMRIEPWLTADAIVATNTSSLRLSDLADGFTDPKRFAALHFLNPAEATAIVEIAPCSKTAPTTVERLFDLARRMNKMPLVLRRDSPGFIWNRLQMAIIRECMQLLDEGVAGPAEIDASVSDGLAPRWLGAGPLATSDLGGSATFRLVAEQLFPTLSTAAAPSKTMGPGFYEWTDESTRRAESIRDAAIRAGRDFASKRRVVAPVPRPKGF